MAFQKIILTADRLRKIGFQGPSRCELCKQSSEDTDHLLFSCLFTQRCWEWLKMMLGWSSPLLKDFYYLLKGWPSNLVKGIYSKLWNISSSMLAWEIWKENNLHIF